MGRTRPDDDGEPGADPVDTDGADDCDAVLADGADDPAGVALDDVPESDPSDGVFTGGVLIGAARVDGVLIEGVVTDGVVRLGVLTGGVVIGPTVTGGTVAVGAVMDGTVAVGAVMDGTVTDGIETVAAVTVGTPRATASPASVSAAHSTEHAAATAISDRLIDLPSGRRTTYQRTSASTLDTECASGKTWAGEGTPRPCPIRRLRASPQTVTDITCPSKPPSGRDRRDIDSSRRRDLYSSRRIVSGPVGRPTFCLSRLT